MNMYIRIKKRREELGMTLKDVATQDGVGESTVRKWETGLIENMKIDKIIYIYLPKL